MNENGLSIFKVEYTPGPTITWAVVIADNLKVNTYLYGQLITSEVNNKKTFFFTSNFDEIGNLLDTIV